MMEPKPLASLTSGLLARKGDAKPAMRPQQILDQMGGNLEDLGWNDMGEVESDDTAEEVREHVPSSIAALTPSPGGRPAASLMRQDGTPAPIVEQRRIEAHFGEAPEIEDEVAKTVADEAIGPAGEVVTLRSRPAEPVEALAPRGGKAAFTLRLDDQRHLRLRLACAVQNRSAQRIVTEALDMFLEALPELDTLAQQVPARQGNRN